MRGALLCFLVAAQCAAGVGDARAQGEAAGDGEGAVRSRTRPELDPLGIRLGAFLFYPSLTLGFDFDDNLLRTEDDEQASLVGRALSSFRLESDWNNHSLALSGSLDLGESLWGEDEEFVDGALGIAGRLDIRRDTQLFGAVLYESLHEDRGSPELAGTGARSSFQRVSANLGLQQRWNRWSFLMEGRYADLDFHDAVTPGGVRLENDDRDREIYIVAARLGYELFPGYETFVRTTVNDRVYRPRDEDVERDSSGYEAVAGVALDLTRLLVGEAYAGYREQRYRDAALGDIGGITFGARLTSNPTPLTTVQVSVSREIEDTSLADGSGFFDTTMQLIVDHELRRNLVLSGAVGYSLQDYRGIDREDEVVRVTFSASYVMNRHFTVAITYDFEERHSDGSDAGQTYASNRFLLKLVGQP